MTKPAHYGTTLTTPNDIIFMTSDALFVKGCQQRNRDFIGQLLFVACGALASFALVSVAKNVKIVVAYPASKDGFVQIVVKANGMFMELAKFPAFKIHNPFFDLFLLGPSRGCYQNGYENQTKKKTVMLHKSLPKLMYT